MSTGFVAWPPASAKGCARYTCKIRRQAGGGDRDPEEEKIDLKTYIFGKEGEFDDDLQKLGTDRRRILQGTLLASAITLGANFLGSTSALLGIFPEQARSLQLDVLYPVGGFKRYLSSREFAFIYPQEWLEDQAVTLFDTSRRVKQLDYSVQRGQPRRTVGPQIAFGPAGGNGSENLSVIKSTLLPGFSLQNTLGSPKEAAEKLLSVSIAPEGSGRTARLVQSGERNNAKYYIFEYVVKGPGFEAHNLSVVTNRESDNSLFTFTILAPESKWQSRAEQFRVCADSFHVFDA